MKNDDKDVQIPSAGLAGTPTGGQAGFLLSSAASLANVSESVIADEVARPDWKSGGTRRWCVHVCDEVRECWAALSDESKLIAVIIALSASLDCLESSWSD